MGPKRKRFDSSNSVLWQLDPNAREKVENIFQKKFTFLTTKNNDIPNLRSAAQEASNLSEHNLPLPNEHSKTLKHPEEFSISKKNVLDKDLDNLNEVSDPNCADVSQGLESDEYSADTHWQNVELQQMKTELNALKDRLSDKDVVAWHKHTGFTNLAGSIVSELRQTFRVELCTQAWSKFFEVVSTYPIVPVSAEDFNSVHLCEAPGAFIAALNHYLVSQAYTCQWKWLGTTLSPYYEGNSLSEMIDDDRFIRSTLDNWYFGEDGTGDIMDKANLQGLMEKAAGLGDIHLVTADGSIDCQNMPAEQEEVVSRLHYCEVITALHILSPGGSLVIKLFTMFESTTICLMYLLCLQFEEVNVFKPVTSKSGNSEVYVICLRYKKTMDPTTLDLLTQRFFRSTSSPEVPIFRQCDIPEEYLQQHLRCCKIFSRLQSDTILSNIQLYPTMTEEKKRKLEQMREYCVETFINQYNLRSIPFYCKIAHQPHKKSVSSFEVSLSCTSLRPMYMKQLKRDDKNTSQHVHMGSFKCRQEQRQLPWKQRIHYFQELNIEEDDKLCLVCTESLHPAELLHWVTGKGRQLQQIQSSRFCEGKFVTQMSEVIQHAKIHHHRMSQMSSFLEEFSAVLTDVLQHLDCTNVDSVLSSDINPYLRDIIDKHGNMADEDTRTKKADSSEEKVVFLSVVNESCQPGQEELDSRTRLLSHIIHTLKTLSEGSFVVVHLYTSLTFFTSGLLYILARVFAQVSRCPHLSGVWLQQVLCFENFQGVHPSLISYLQTVETEMTTCDDHNTVLLDVLPKSCILSDTVFTKFLVGLNRSMIGHFVNSVIALEKAESPKTNDEVEKSPLS